mgnify:CR=1 FL=1
MVVKPKQPDVGGPPAQHKIVVIITSSKVAAQGELEIVQRRVAVPAATNPVTPDVGEVGVVMVAVPANTVHKPVPGAGLFPAKVAVVTPQAGLISEPAAAAGAVAVTLTEAVLACTEPQLLLAAKV